MTRVDAQSPKPSRPRKPNYHQIHAQPLPIRTYALPPLIPNNPLSLLQIAYTILSQYLFPPLSHNKPICKGYWSSETRSVHVTHSQTIRVLWEKGFFGKGSLSRSEPTWLQTESVKRGKAEKQTSEAMTMQRREERRRMKNERAVKTQEAIEQIRKLELAKGNGYPAEDEKENRTPTTVKGPVRKVTEAPPPELDGTAASNLPLKERDPNRQTNNPPRHSALPDDNIDNNSAKPPVIRPQKPRPTQPTFTADDLQSQFFSRVEALKPTSDISTQQEHLQLTSSEAFFLCYALGSLEVYSLSITTLASASAISEPPDSKPFTTVQLLRLFLSSSSSTNFSPTPTIFCTASIRPDHTFLLNYVTYHHFRSLGWAPRPGLKFGCDFLLYPNGPAIEHAPFGVIVLASYAQDAWWRRTEERIKYVRERERKRTWQWWHAVNRVQGQVKKGVVVCWVEVPGLEMVGQCLGEGEEGEALDLGRLLGMYTIREMVCRRWSPNRGRD